MLKKMLDAGFRRGSGGAKVARGETSGHDFQQIICAPEVRQEKTARASSAHFRNRWIQTFHIWLPSLRRYRGESLHPAVTA